MRRFSPRAMRWWPFFPLTGIMAALALRAPEHDPHTFSPPRPDPVRTKTLSLPDGNALRFIGIADPAGGVAFYLAERETPPAIRDSLAPDPLSHTDALAFARDLSALTGESLRLPTAAEWRLAARGGVANAQVPWGFGPRIPPGVRFGLDRPPSRPGPALGHGFRDMAGGRWEWTMEGTALGSAWSERDPATLRIDHAWRPPPGYAGGDIATRLLWERQ